MQVILHHCKLVQYQRGVGYSPLLNGWEEFIREYELDDIEVAYYSINGKRWIYVRLGAWNKSSHPSKTPAEIWSAALADKLVIPRLQITALSNQLASDIDEMGVNFRSTKDEGELLTLGSESESDAESDLGAESEAECESDFEKEHDAKSSTAVSNEIDFLPDQSEYPLLHFLLSSKLSANTFNQLVNEIVKFSGGITISYRRGNNTEGTLLPVPFFHNIMKYQKELSKDGTLIDAAVKAIEKSAKCDEQEAAESLLSGICSRYEDAF